MNPQEQNKAKAPFQSQPPGPPGIQKNEAPQQPLAANVKPVAKDSAKPEDKDAGSCNTDKGSCGTK